MKYAELNALSNEKLVHRELDLERQLLELSFRKRMGQLEDNSKLAKVRKDIARARTAERAREVAEGLDKDSLRGLHASSWKLASANQAEGGDQATSTGRRGFVRGLLDKIKGSE